MEAKNVKNQLTNGEESFDRIKLSPRAIYDSGKDGRAEEDPNNTDEQNSYFNCTICMKIVLEPKECSNCQTLFCTDCI